MCLKLYIRKSNIHYPVAIHIISTTFPPLIFLDAHVKLVKNTRLIRCILWIDLFVEFFMNRRLCRVRVFPAWYIHRCRLRRWLQLLLCHVVSFNFPFLFLFVRTGWGWLREEGKSTIVTHEALRHLPPGNFWWFFGLFFLYICNDSWWGSCRMQTQKCLERAQNETETKQCPQ